MSNVLVLTGVRAPAAQILPSLSLLRHAIRVASAEAVLAGAGPAPDVVLVDARSDLVRVRQLFRQLRQAGIGVPLLAIVTEGGWAAVTAEWDADDLVLNTAGPGEVEARLRLAISRMAGSEPAEPAELRSGVLVIDEATYSARMHGRALDLTFKEFELLKFLAQHPRRVFTRSQLLQEVWGYDYFGGTRTVDVHVRRLRAKLGAEHETLIGTVRNVGYRFVPAKAAECAARPPQPAGSGQPAGESGQPAGESGQPAGESGQPAHGAMGRAPAGRWRKEASPARADS